MGNRAEGKTGCAEPRARPQKNSSHPNIFKMQPIYMGVTLHSAGDAEDYETLQRVGLMTVTHLEIASMAPRFESSVDKLTITMFNREQFPYVQEERASKEAEEKVVQVKLKKEVKGTEGKDEVVAGEEDPQRGQVPRQGMATPKPGITAAMTKNTRAINS